MRRRRVPGCSWRNEQRSRALENAFRSSIGAQAFSCQSRSSPLAAGARNLTVAGGVEPGQSRLHGRELQRSVCGWRPARPYNPALVQKLYIAVQQSFAGNAKFIKARTFRGSDVEQASCSSKQSHLCATPTPRKEPPAPQKPRMLAGRGASLDRAFRPCQPPRRLEIRASVSTAHRPVEEAAAGKTRRIRRRLLERTPSRPVGGHGGAIQRAAIGTG